MIILFKMPISRWSSAVCSAGRRRSSSMSHRFVGQAGEEEADPANAHHHRYLHCQPVLRYQYHGAHPHRRHHRFYCSCALRSIIRGAVMIYGLLFWEFFKVGIFLCRRRLCSMPLIQASVVDTFHWLTMSEFVDIFTISQMTPGPIGINAATFVGTRIAGLPGAIVAPWALSRRPFSWASSWPVSF